MKLKDKVAIITGSTRGIGYEIAKLYLSEGAHVMVLGSSDESALKAVSKLKEELNLDDEVISGMGINLKDNLSIKDVVNSTIIKFGRLDILVNNAGITSREALEDLTDEAAYNMFEINYFGPMRLIRECVPYLKDNGGSIINTSSMVGLYGASHQVAYTSSKFAINGLTKACAKELGVYNIRVNAVSPGVVGTDMVSGNVTEEMKQGLIRMTPLRRMATPSDLAGVYLYLASDDASFTTGAIIQVDGGLIM